MTVLHESRHRVLRACIVNTETADIVIRSSPALCVGKRISFVKLSDWERMKPSRRPSAELWRSGVIWRIEKNCLHLTRT